MTVWEIIVTPDEDGKFYITDYSRQRVTGGVTLSFGKAFFFRGRICVLITRNISMINYLWQRVRTRQVCDGINGTVLKKRGGHSCFFVCPSCLFLFHPCLYSGTHRHIRDISSGNRLFPRQAVRLLPPRRQAYPHLSFIISSSFSSSSLYCAAASINSSFLAASCIGFRVRSIVFSICGLVIY